MLPVLARRRQNEICRIHLRRACCGQKKYHPPGSEPRACPLEVESGARLGSLAPDSRSLALGSTSLALYRLEKPGSKLDKQSSVWSKPGAYTLRACARCRRPLPRPPCIWQAIHTADRMRGTRGKKGGILRDLKLSLEPVFQKMRSDGNYWQTR